MVGMLRSHRTVGTPSVGDLPVEIDFGPMGRGARFLAWCAALAAALALAGLAAGSGDEGGPLPHVEVPKGAAAPPMDIDVTPKGTVTAAPRVLAPAATDGYAELVRATGGITGVVRGRAGLPVPDAFVYLIDRSLERRVGFTRADRQGRFSFLRTGDLVDAAEELALAGHHAEHGFAEPRLVLLPRAGQVESVELSLDRDRVRIEGRVLGPDAAPFPDFPVALVWMEGPDRNAPDWLVGGSDADLRTDEDGRFVALGMRAGRYEVEYEPDTIPLGFREDPPEALVEIDAGSGPIRLEVASVRVDVEVVEGLQDPQVADRIAFRVFTPDDADRIGAAYPGRTPIPTVGEFDQRQSIEKTASTAIFVAPGALVVVAASRGGRVVEQRYRVRPSPARQVVRLDFADVAVDGTSVRLDVRRPSGDRPVETLVRVRRPDGLLHAPVGLADVGSGFCVLPASGEIRLPPGPARLEVLGDGFEVGRAWFETDTRITAFDLEVPAPPGRVERRVDLGVAAYLEIEVTADQGSPSAAARAAWLDQSGDASGPPLLKAYASAETEELGETALRLAWIGADGGWHPARGVPHVPGSTTLVRPLGAFTPGAVRFSLQSWRPATADDARGRTVALVPGRNVLRYRLGLDGVLYPVGP